MPSRKTSEGRHADERRTARQQRSRPLIDALEPWLRAKLGLISQKSKLANATAPILIRIYKEESTLEVWKQDRTGKFALLKSYPICKFSGKLGPKIVQGDYQAPEGFYDITPEQMNPLSNEYLSFTVISVFPMPLIDLLGEPVVFLWCMAAADQSAVTP